MGKVGKVVTSVVAGIALTGAVAAVGIFALNDAGATSISESTVRSYQGKYYDHEGVCIFETPVTRRGDPLYYPDPSTYSMTYVDYDTGAFHQFSGWDINGDNIPDPLGDRMYFSFNAKAAYIKVPSMQDLEIDPEILAKITEQMIDALIKSGLLNEDQEIPEWLLESLVNMIEYLTQSGLNLEDIDVNLLQELLDKLGLSIEDLAQMFGLDIETLLGIFNAPAFQYVASDWSTPHFFRTTSKGDYKKGKWTNPDFYSKDNISEGSINPLEYAFNKLSISLNPVSYNFTYLKPGKTFPTPAYEFGNTQGLDSDAYALKNPTPAPTEEYPDRSTYQTLGYGFYPASSYSVILAKMGKYSDEIIAEDELKYREYAREKYLNIDKKYKDYLLEFALEHEITVDEQTYSHISKINEVFSKWKMQDFTMELQAYPKGEDRLMYFIENPDIGGRSGEFATATTLLYRALGVPARYVTGYFDINLEKEEIRTVGGLQAHDWVEIYIDGIGWLMVDTSISSAIPPEMSNLLFGSPDVDMNNEIGELESIEATLEETTYFENATIDPYKIKIKSIYSNGQSFDITWHIPEGYDPDGENNDGNLNSRSISPTNITAVNKNNKKQSLQIYIPPTSTAGNYKIKVFYKDDGVTRVDTIDIEIIKPKIVSLQVDTGTYQDWYLQNTTIDISDMKVLATYNDPAKKPVLLNITDSILYCEAFINNEFSSATLGKFTYRIYLSEDHDVYTDFDITISDKLPDTAVFYYFHEVEESSENNPYKFLVNKFEPENIPFVFVYRYSKKIQFTENDFGVERYNDFIFTTTKMGETGKFEHTVDASVPGLKNVPLTYNENGYSSTEYIWIRIRDVDLSIEIRNFKEYDGNPFSSVEILTLHELKEDNTMGEGNVLEQNEHVEYRINCDEINFDNFIDAGLYTASVQFRIVNDLGEIITSNLFEGSEKTELVYYDLSHNEKHEELHFHEDFFEPDSEGWIDLDYFDFSITRKKITIETQDVIYDEYRNWYTATTDNYATRFTDLRDSVLTSKIDLIDTDYILWETITFNTLKSTENKCVNGFSPEDLRIYSSIRGVEVTENYAITYKFGTITRG